MSSKYDLKKDYYEILGIKNSADIPTIRAAYRALSKKYHPDLNKNGSTTDMFKVLNEAYHVLSDEDLKKEYDTHRGTHSPTKSSSLGDHVWNDIWNSSVFVDRQESNSVNVETIPGEDLEISLDISLKESYTGVKKETTTLTGKMVDCIDCPINQDSMMCTHCMGAGSRLRITPGSGIKRDECKNCKGVGKINLRKNCKSCIGKGKINLSKSVTITIPSGIQSGDRLRIAGQGKPGHNDSPGDLFVTVTVKNETAFSRDNLDLRLSHKIPLKTAIVGGSIDITHIDGSIIKVDIPRFRSGANIIRIPGKGMTHPVQHRTGDLYLNLDVEFPDIDLESANSIAKFL